MPVIIKAQKEISTTIAGQMASRRVWLKGKELHPGESQKIRNHSPDGFNWGYGGSGPAQLALAIMLKLTNKENAIRLYQPFKWAFVAKWQGDFTEEMDNVLSWILKGGDTIQ